MYFGENDIEYARNVDMIEFLGATEGFTFKRSGSGWRCVEHDSLYVKSDCHSWYWNSRGVKGVNAIDWLMNVRQHNFAQSVVILAQGRSLHSTARRFPTIRSQPTEHEKVLNLPPAANGKWKRAFAYLCAARKLDPEIVSQLMRDKSIYQDERNNVVFVGRDSNGTPKFASVRGTLSDVRYRGDCPGSDKRYGFSVTGTDRNRLYVFESPIDAISHATMVKLAGGDWRRDTRLSLGGTSCVALSQYLSEHKEVKEIICCLDNDDGGNSGADMIRKKFSANGLKVCRLTPLHKDFNEDLCAGVSLAALPGIKCSKPTLAEPAQHRPQEPEQMMIE